MLDDFFAYARERHAIYLRRAAGLPEPWTTDPILAKYRFCNVFRELDRVTQWVKKYVRDPYDGRPEALLAVVVARLFNRIATLEAIFSQIDIEGGNAFDKFARTGEKYHLHDAILKVVGLTGPFVTGSYIIKTPEGYSKLTGVLEILQRFYHGEYRKRDVADWRSAAQNMLEHGWELEQIHNWLEAHYFIGHFTAYEVTTDLRHTKLGGQARDIMDWANPGPGATRGLNRILGRDLGKTPPKDQQLGEMQKILDASAKSDYWPQAGDGVLSTMHDVFVPDNMELHVAWPKWEMREVEHTLCEFDKYQRTLAGDGRPRGVFR